MPTTYDQARTAFLATGRVVLQGRASFWPKVLTVLLWVLQVLTVLLAVGTFAGIIVAYANGIFVNPIGFAVPVMGGVLVFGVRFVRLRHADRMKSQKLPVTIARDGFTVRGIGPIPWHDVQPPANRLVPARHDSGFQLRAVLTLTQSGFRNVNALSPQQRRLLGPTNPGAIWSGPRTSHIDVPDVEGLSTAETMQLLAEAHHAYWSRHPHAQR